MNCPSCGAASNRSSRFCSECGAPLAKSSPVRSSVAGPKRTKALAEATPQPTQPAPKQFAKLRHAAEAQIDQFLRQAGVPDPADLTDEQGWRRIQLGSASGRAGIVESEGELYLQADAHVMPLPSDQELIVPLMRELLEFNTHISGSERVGIGGEAVVAVGVRRISELQSDDFARCIYGVMALADNLDDQLIAKYGGTSKQRTPANGSPAKHSKR
jgi:hypothetical protein